MKLLKLKKMPLILHLKRIYLIDILCFLALFIYIEPAYISYNFPFVDLIYTQLKNIIFCFIVCREIVVMASSKHRSSYFVYLVFFAHCVVILSNIVNHIEVMSAIARMINTTATVYISELEFKRSKQRFCAMACGLLSVFIIINFITIFLFPNGLYAYYMIDGSSNSMYWFLGHKNSISKICVITLCFQLLCNQMKGKFWNGRIIVLSAISLISVMRVNSSGGMIMLLLFLCAMYGLSILYGLHLERCSVLFRMKNYAIAAIAAFLFVAVFQTVVAGTGIANFIQNTLNRDITLTGRTIVWKQAMMRISQKPILGYGIRDVMDMILLVKGTVHTSDCHNYYINVLFQGGLVAGILFGWIFYSMIQHIDKIRETKFGLILSITLFSFMIIFITECFYYCAMWMMFVVMYHCEDFCKNSKYLI